jgi:hypothetical protein
VHVTRSLNGIVAIALSSFLRTISVVNGGWRFRANRGNAREDVRLFLHPTYYALMAMSRRSSDPASPAGSVFFPTVAKFTGSNWLLSYFASWF